MSKENVTKTTPSVIRGAIFDMDGTLIDSMWIWERYASRYIRSRGLSPAADLDDAVATFTLAESAAYLAATYRLDGGAERVARELAEGAVALYDRVTPKAGALAMLEAFRRAGVRMALATMTERPTAERVLSRLGILPYLSHIFTCDEVGALKSSPKIYREALRALGTKREETPVFEDAPFALATAARDGFPTVFVLDGHGARDPLASARAFLTVGDLADAPWERYLPKSP